MKKIKKLVACLSAAAIAMTVGVSAFAATATYEDGFVKVADAPIDDVHQWTVVVIAADKADATLTAEDLYYINQGTSGETFWTNGMGTKTELTDGDYIVRIGGETITDPGQLIEIPFTVGTSSTGKTITVKWGDITGDGNINSSDALSALMYLAGTAESYTIDGTTFTVGTEIDGYTWGDITGDGNINSSDALSTLMYLAGTAESHTVNGSNITVGNDVNIVVSQN